MCSILSSAKARPTWVGCPLSTLRPALGVVKQAPGCHPVGGRREPIQGREQPVLADHLVQTAKARGGALLLDQKDRVDRARRIVERDDQIERPLAGQPRVRRAVLKEHHAGQRPARPLLAVRRAARRDRHQTAALQHCLRPGVAQGKPVLGLQRFVEVLDREVPIPRPILLDDKLDAVHRRAPPGGAPTSPINQAGIVNLSGRGMLLVSVARQLGSGNSFACLSCCPAQAERGRSKAPSVR